MIRIAMALMLISISAMAQPRTELRDKSGNLLGYTQKEGDRMVQRDPSGNAQGYWRREGDDMVHRDNSGNLLAREKVVR